MTAPNGNGVEISGPGGIGLKAKGAMTQYWIGIVSICLVMLVGGAYALHVLERLENTRREETAQFEKVRREDGRRYERTIILEGLLNRRTQDRTQCTLMLGGTSDERARMRRSLVTEADWERECPFLRGGVLERAESFQGATPTR